MKISKQRLKEIIKEELSGLGESDEARDASLAKAQQLTDIATPLGGKKFAGLVNQAIASAAAGLNTDDARGKMAEALEILSGLQETEDSRTKEAPEEDEERFVGVSWDKIKQQKQAAHRRKADGVLRSKLKYVNPK